MGWQSHGCTVAGDENDGARLTGLLEAKLPDLATKTETARLEGSQDKPSKSWLSTAAATFVAVITLGVTVGALVGPVFGKWLNSCPLPGR